MSTIVKDLFKFNSEDEDLEGNLSAFIETCKAEKLVNTNFLNKCATIPLISMDSSTDGPDAYSTASSLVYKKLPTTLDQRILLYHELAHYFIGMTKTDDDIKRIISFCNSQILSSNLSGTSIAKDFCRGLISIDKSLCDEFSTRITYKSFGLPMPEVKSYQSISFGNRIFKSNFKSIYKPLQEPIYNLIGKSDLRNFENAFLAGINGTLFENLTTSFPTDNFLRLSINLGKLFQIIKDPASSSDQDANNKLYSEILYQIETIDDKNENQPEFIV